MPLFVLSPCGTSLLTKLATIDERKLTSQYANVKKIEDLPEADRKILESLKERVKKEILLADIHRAMELSAELNGIIKLYKGQIQDCTRDQHFLLSTDTWLGGVTADLVKTWLETHEINAIPLTIKGLQTENLFDFQYALSEIVQWCEETILGYKRAEYHIVFNLTGGFKSVQGFLQALAMFYADESIYVFESSRDLLRIPRLPIEINAKQIVSENLVLFRRLFKELKIKEVSNIPEILITNYQGMFDFSPWGQIVWNQSKNEIYAQGLHPSPSDLIRYEKQFIDSVKGLSGDRYLCVNQCIDKLAKYLETNPHENPTSLDFKMLKHNPYPPSTHEMDAWSDLDAKRIFSHFEGSICVLDRLGNALH